MDSQAGRTLLSIPFLTAARTALSVAGALGSGPDFATLVMSASTAYGVSPFFAVDRPTTMGRTFKQVAAALSLPFMAALRPSRSCFSRPSAETATEA